MTGLRLQLLFDCVGFDFGLICDYVTFDPCVLSFDILSPLSLSLFMVCIRIISHQCAMLQRWKVLAGRLLWLPTGTSTNVTFATRDTQISDELCRFGGLGLVRRAVGLRV